jgi:dTDP-4-amino-4,6-dideoxygalactose transaminase
MKIPFLDLSRKQRSQQTYLELIFRNCLLNDYLAGGKNISLFEEAFARYLNVPYCIGCGNGTDALEIVLRALHIRQGDEVIVPANGWLSAAEMVKLLGATPVFVDVEPSTHNLDPQQLSAAINSKTRAIVPIHLYGLTANMPAIMDIAEKQGLYVIEDCAQAHGASVHGKKAGSWGHAAAFSFYPTKNLGALGDAGAMVTADPALAEKCRMVANHGQSMRDQHHVLGRNSRMDTLQAAVLYYRLQLLDEENRQRRHLAGIYRDQLQDLPIQLPMEHEMFNHVFHLFVISSPERDRLKAFLQKSGIGTAIHYPHAVSDMEPLNPMPAKVARRQSREVLSLPLYPEMTEEEVMLIARHIRTFFKSNGRD